MNAPRQTALVAAMMAASLAACVSTRPLEHQPCPCAPGFSCDVSQNICVADENGSDGGASIPAMFSADAIQAALSNCTLPHGPPATTVITPNDAKAALTGAWVPCPSETTLPQTIFTPGIRLEANGNFEILTPDGSGGLVTGVGLLSQGTWATSCYNVDPTLVPDAANKACPGTSPYGLQAYAHTVGGDDSPAHSFGGAVSFETSPVRAYAIEWTGGTSDVDPLVKIELWLVPLQ
jgi:hypothetical protein